jgi:uncharacterized protein
MFPAGSVAGAAQQNVGHLTMKRSFYILILLLPAFPVASGAASFDCARAGTTLEKMICADQALSALDERLAQAYKSALSETANAKDIRQQQKRWLENVRDKCTSRACLVEVYEKRIKELASQQSEAPKSSAGEQEGEKEKWLSSRLYGSDNEIAALKEVKIWQEAGKYWAHIKNQFSFKCELTFGSNGMPQRLSQCESMLRPGDEWYDGSLWATKENEIPVSCSVLKNEIVCKGKYTMLPIGESDYMTIARRK